MRQAQTGGRLNREQRRYLKKANIKSMVLG
jgi:hypothetical protein